MVGIAGGSGSGKTTLATAVVERLGRERVARLSHDAYYRDRADVPMAARAALDFDVPDAFDQALFLADLEALRGGRPVRPPRYCFLTHRRLGHEAPVEPRDIVLVEGILVLCDAHACAALDLKVYVDAPAPVRLARRLVRDIRERGRTPDSVLAQFATTVAPAHEAHVEPSRARADLVVDNVEALAVGADTIAAAIRGRLAERVAGREVLTP
jgi:uridine kinase